MSKIKKVKKIKFTPDMLRIPNVKFLEILGLTQSLLNAYQQCKRKFIFKANGWKFKEKSDKFLFGSMFHEALDLLYSGESLSFDEFENYYRETKLKEFHNIDQQKVETEFTLCEIMLEAYKEYYPEDFTEKRFDGVEEEFNVTVFDTKLRGKKDGNFYTKNKRWLMEHKTKSRFNEDTLMLQLSFDFQNLFYINADEMTHKEEIAGVLYNVIRKPQLKRTKKEALSEFCMRVKEDVKKRPEWYFIRWEIPYTKQDKKRFRIELNQKILDIKSACSLNHFYKQENSCYNGMFTCEYLTACASNSFTGLTKTDDIFPELDDISEEDRKLMKEWLTDTNQGE